MITSAKSVAPIKPRLVLLTGALLI